MTEKRIVCITDVCSSIFAGGDAPKKQFSFEQTEECCYPVFSNGESNNGLYGYTNTARVTEPSITVSARGTIGFTAIRLTPFTPIVRLISITPIQEIIDIDYLYYALSNYTPENTGTSIPQLTVPMIKKYKFRLPEKDEQKRAVKVLKQIDNILEKEKKQIQKLDELIKSRFVEMFGDPISNTRGLVTKVLKDVLILKAGDFTAASDISDEPTDKKIYPCYGGNGIRGYVSDYNQEGEYSLVGRQGALSGNVQFAKGKFKNTEHALLVTPLVEMNNLWLNQLLINLDLKRYQTGAAQPGLSVKNLQEIPIVAVPIEEQDYFADFVTQVEKQKATVHQSIDKLETLKKSLMQEYFG